MKEDAFAPPRGWDPEDMFIDELRHFLACLSGEASSEPDLPSGAEALRVALTVLDSAERGEQVATG